MFNNLLFGTGTTHADHLVHVIGLAVAAVLVIAAFCRITRRRPIVVRAAAPPVPAGFPFGKALVVIAGILGFGYVYQLHDTKAKAAAPAVAHATPSPSPSPTQTVTHTVIRYMPAHSLLSGIDIVLLGLAAAAILVTYIVGRYFL